MNGSGAHSGGAGAPGVPGSPESRSAPSAPSTPSVLGPAFAGRPASTGARLVAFTIDVVLIAAVVVGVVVGTGSATLGVVVAVQLAIGFAVALARTGATPGNLLLRLRAARDDAPFSPGAGRACVRALITGAGFLVGIGSWIVIASSAWGSDARRRSWADRAAGTVVVAVPRSRAEAVPVAPAVAPPLVFSTSARPALDDDEAPVIAAVPLVPAASIPPAPAASPLPPAPPAAGFAPGAMPSAPPLAPAPPVAPPTAPAVGAATPVVRATARPAFAPAASAAPASAAPARGALLLVFDTGQRVRVELPGSANLGRRPAASEPGDQLIAVDDPDSTVSKTHLRLEHSRGRTWATDLGSTNGSGVFADDGRRTELAPGARTLLDDGDRVRIGDRTFTVHELLPSGQSERGESA